MKSSDLRIGNIVKLKDSADIVKVCAITKRKIGFHAPGERPDAQLRYRRLSEIEGVPIYDYWQKIDCPDLSYDDRLAEDGWYVYRRIVLDIQLRFLHELQNIHYALTGNEIEIEL